MDFKILYFLNGMHNPILDKIMICLTYLAEKGLFFIVLAFVLLFFKKTRKCGAFILISMAIGLIIGNGAIKNLVARSRPCWIDETINLLIKNPKDYSFPSGHTLASFETSITILTFNKKWGVVSIIIAILIGISRMYLFVHFPTDVLAGAILGTVIALLVHKVGNSIINKKIKETKGEENEECI